VTQLEAFFLGILQGITEFLPISSSGHLVAAQYFFGIREPQLMFNIVLHLGTMSALILLYGKDIFRLTQSLGPRRFYPGPEDKQKMDRKFVLLLIIASIPTALIGMYLSKYADQLFSSLFVAGIGLLVTGMILFSTKFAKKKNGDISPKKALLVGIAQGIAVIPGISRSGFTIATGMMTGADKMTVARFSFILSIPAVAGATLLEWMKMDPSQSTLGFEGLTGFAMALVSGYFALIFLLRLLAHGKFHRFAYYCWALGSVLVGISLFS